MTQKTLFHRTILTSFISIFLSMNHNLLAQVGIATTTPLSTFEVNGSVGQNITSTSTDITLDSTHSIVVCNNSYTSITVTLPNSIEVKGRIYSIKRNENSSQNVIISPTAEQLIDYESNFILTQARQSITIISDGSNWKIIGDYNPQLASGELSYFSTSGNLVDINSTTTDGSTNMFLCNPETTITTNSVQFISSKNGQLQYKGTNKQTFRITATVSAKASSNGVYLYEFRRSNSSFIPASRVLEKLNSADNKTTSIAAFVTLEPNDYIELWLGKIDGTGSVTINSLNLFASGI